MPNDIKKVLIFSTAYLPLIGGAELAVGNIADRISDFEFDLITAKIRPDLSNFEKIGDINVYRVGWGVSFDKLLLPFLGLLKALRLNKKNHYSVVWAIMASYGGFAGLFFKILKPQVKFLLTLQEGDDLAYIKKRVGIFNFLFEAIFKRADHIQAISKFLAEWAKNLGAKCPIEVVPNGVDSGIFKPAWTAENLDKKIIITVSRLVEKNGVRHLIEAMQDVDGELWIIGEGALRIDLEKSAAGLGIGKRVKFFGNLSAQEVAIKLAQASIFVRPSLSEGLGNAFLEAMAMGIPVIGTPVGGIPDFLKDGETGWICEVKNPKGIAEKINHILDGKNKAEVERVAQAANKMVEEKYDWEILALKIDGILQKLSRPKILIATGIYPPDIGGPATMIAELRRSLADSGLQVSVITYSNSSDFSDGVVRIQKNRRLAKISYLLSLLRLSQSADVIYCTDTYSVGYFSYLIKKIFRKPYIIRFAGDSAWETASANGWAKDDLVKFQEIKYGRKIERLKVRCAKIIRSADKVIAVSGFMERIAKKIGAKERDIKVIYNSVDFEKNQAIDKAEFRNKFGLSPEDKILMTACRLTPWKGVDGLIKVVKGLSPFIPVKLIVLGEGRELENLMGLVEELKIGESVIFAGAIPQDEMIGYLACADVFILNTSYEGLSHTLLEAVRAKVPIIASNAGGNPEVIQSGVNGILVDYNDVEQIKVAIKIIFDDLQQAQRFVDEASRQSAKFSWVNVVSQTIQLIMQIR